eukprot:TRINITY_DN7275_c0_g1_i2.p1 TRINITY_DN7275_c0_g1~~TRINITY_DN7275_c0_g1_i2.p1  ORF type:complete len:895 (+),score=134.21 TRINITY_DN7275_c0_g1_i2:341-2686(+)
MAVSPLTAEFKDLANEHFMYPLQAHTNHLTQGYHVLDASTILMYDTDPCLELKRLASDVWVTRGKACLHSELWVEAVFHDSRTVYLQNTSDILAMDLAAFHSSLTTTPSAPATRSPLSCQTASLPFQTPIRVSLAGANAAGVCLRQGNVLAFLPAYGQRDGFWERQRYGNHTVLALARRSMVLWDKARSTLTMVTYGFAADELVQHMLLPNATYSAMTVIEGHYDAIKIAVVMANASQTSCRVFVIDTAHDELLLSHQLTLNTTYPLAGVVAVTASPAAHLAVVLTDVDGGLHFKTALRRPDATWQPWVDYPYSLAKVDWNAPSTLAWVSSSQLLLVFRNCSFYVYNTIDTMLLSASLPADLQVDQHTVPALQQGILAYNTTHAHLLSWATTHWVRALVVEWPVRMVATAGEMSVVTAASGIFVYDNDNGIVTKLGWPGDIWSSSSLQYSGTVNNCSFTNSSLFSASTTTSATTDSSTLPAPFTPEPSFAHSAGPSGQNKLWIAVGVSAGLLACMIGYSLRWYLRRRLRQHAALVSSFMEQDDDQLLLYVEEDSKGQIILPLKQRLDGQTEQPSQWQAAETAIVTHRRDAIELLQALPDQSLNELNEHGQSLLTRAVLHGNLPVVEYLMSACKIGTVCKRDRQGFAPIHWACLINEYDILEAMVEACPAYQNLVLLHTSQGRSLLHLAVLENNVQMLKGLLDISLRRLESRLLAKDQCHGETPLNMARRLEHTECEAVLLGRLEYLQVEGKELVGIMLRTKAATLDTRWHKQTKRAAFPLT